VKFTIEKSLSWIVILFIAVILVNPVNALAGVKDKDQRRAKRDSIKRARDLSPHKASLWAIIPGGGQVYNHKYWKLPIVYAGFGVIGYFIITNRDYYLKYNDAYICSANADNDPDFECDDPLAENYSTNDLQQYKDFYRRNTELSVILGAVWYLLTLVDATVDAHLSHWEVNDNLSFDVQPVIQPVGKQINIPTQAPAFNGLKLSFRF